LDINVIEDDPGVYWGNIFDKLILGQMFPTATVIMKKDCIDMNNLFNTNYKSGEAYDFHARIAKDCEVAFIDYSTMEYRRFHSGQLSSQDMEIDTNLSWVDTALNLWVNDQEYYQKHKKFVDWRMSHYYCGLGVVYYKKQRYSEALENFIKSLKLNLGQKKIYIYTVLSLIKSFKKNKKKA
jgi:tetratricopeptide (TPR) repeat protein